MEEGGRGWWREMEGERPVMEEEERKRSHIICAIYVACTLHECIMVVYSCMYTV